MAILDGKYVVDNEIDILRHDFIGVQRRPLSGYLNLGNILACPCGQSLSLRSEIIQHWRDGHFDIGMYETRGMGLPAVVKPPVPVPWTAVLEALPDKDGAYLVHAESSEPGRPLITIAWYNPAEGKGWSLLPKFWIKAITHWMPMPDGWKAVQQG